MQRTGCFASLIALVLIFHVSSASALVVNIDNFEVIKNGASLMSDDFNVPGPLNEAGLFPSGAQAFYGLKNSVAQSEGVVAGRRTLDTSAAPVSKSDLAGIIFKDTLARLLTNTQPLSVSTLGLKRDDTFSVIGIFDLVVPEEPLGVYGIRLEDVNGPGPSNDVLRLDVRKISSGIFIRFSHFDIAALVHTELERIPLETDHDQVMLKLEKLDAGLDTITASFAYIDDSVVGPTSTFSATRDIFNGEDYTRAAFRALGQIGQTRHVAETTIDHNWASVPLPPTFVDPVIIAGPPTFHGTQPGVVRLRNVTPDGFEVRFQEWLYLDGTHLQENLPYLAITSGRHQMPDGSIWEAGRFSLGGTGVWQTAAFNLPFAAPPALFLTVQTFNGDQPVTVRARNVTTSGFEAALFEEEALMDGHLVETVGYLAVHSPQGSGTTGFGSTTRLPYLLQSPSVTWRHTPVLSSKLRMEEELSADDGELFHIPETLSVLAVGDKLFAQDVSSNGGDTAALRRVAPEYAAPMEWGTVTGVNHDWTTVPLAKQYVNPVVVAKPVSTNGGQPGAIRVRNVTANSFELRFQEWLYLDGAHLDERVFYMVAEAGQFTVAGLDVEAGRLDTNLLLSEGWEGVNLTAPFLDSPAVFAGVMTFNGSDTVITRVDSVTSTNFLVTMDEEEAKNDSHLTETLGWIAIEQGSGVVPDFSFVRVASVTLDHVPANVSLPPFVTEPASVSIIPGLPEFNVFVADVMSTRGPDPVSPRYENLSGQSVDLFLQEERSADSEVFHVLEDVSVFQAQ